MQLFSAHQIISSVFASLLHGAVSAIIAVMIDRVILYSGQLVRLPIIAVKIHSARDTREYRIVSVPKKSGAGIFIFDVVFVLFYTVTMLILGYVFCDGIVRLYPIVFSLFTMGLVYKYFASYIGLFLDKAVSLLYRPMLLFLYIILYPSRLIAEFVYKMCVAPLLGFVRKKILDKKESLLIKSKLSVKRYAFFRENPKEKAKSRKM